MRLFDDFFSIAQTPRRTVLLLALTGMLSGVANAAILAIVGETLRQNDFLKPVFALGLFILTALLYLVLYRYSQTRTAHEVENANANMRLRILDAIFLAPAINSERIEHHFKHLVLSRDTTQVAAALPAIVAILSSLTTVACALGYMLWVSPAAAAAVLFVIVVASFIYETLIRQTGKHPREALVENDRAFGFIDDLLYGYKELKLDSKRAHEFHRNDLIPSIKSTASLLGKVRASQQDINLIGLSAFLLLLAFATFLTSVLDISNSAAVSIMLVLMYIQAHVYGVLQQLPALVEMRQAAHRIREFKYNLSGHDDRPSETPFDLHGRNQLSLHNASFSYPDSDNRFHLKNINLMITRGQTIFIVGGNGSGKTTLAKFLLGLYKPALSR